MISRRVMHLLLTSCSFLFVGCSGGHKCDGGWSVIVESSALQFDSVRFVLTDANDTILDVSRNGRENSPFAVGKSDFIEQLSEPFQVSIVFYCGKEQITLLPFSFSINEDGTSSAFVNLSGENGGDLIGSSNMACGDVSNARVLFSRSDTCS